MMTESEQAQALQAAFPVDPASETLKQRVENLTPLAPVVTGYKFKFRHAFAAFAVLWIGHNVPAAIKNAGNERAYSMLHTRTWRMMPNPVWRASANGKNSRILVVESWRKGNLSKTHWFSPTNPTQEFVNLYRDGVSYTYYPFYFPKTHQVFISHKRPQETPIFDKLRDQFIAILPILLLRTHDNRPIEYRNSKQVKVSRIDSLTLYYDPLTESIMETKMDSANEEIFSEVQYNIPIPDSTFEPSFPQGTQYIEQNQLPSGITHQPPPSASNLWERLKLQVRTYTVGQHP